MNEELKKDYIKYSDVETKEIEWLWFPYLPKGMVSIVQGDPKSGKTFMLIDIISRITRGDYMPLSVEKFEMGNVAKEGHCLSYRITNDGLVWLEDKGEVDVNEVANQDSNTKFENAKNFILECIASKGDISATELQQLCNFGGFSERTFNGARSYLNKNNKIHSIKKNGRTYWSLSSPIDDNVQSCNVESEVMINE